MAAKRGPVAAIGVAIACLGLAACGGVGGGGDDGDGGSGESTGGEISGRMTTMGFGTEDEIAKARVAAVRKAYPDLTVKIVSGGFDEQQFLSAVASGEPPDAVYLDRSDLGTYAARGALMDMTGCLDANGVDMDQYRDAAVQQVTYDGKVYGVPEFNSVRVVLGNTTALRDAGTSADGVDTGDWQKLDALNKRLTRSVGGLERIGFDPKLPEFFPLWAAANGGQLLSDDGLTASIDLPENVEALDFAVGLVDDNGGWSKFKAFRDTWDFFGDNNEFVSDQIGAFPMDDWYLDVLADVSPDAPIAALPFKGRDGQPLTYATGQAWAVPSDAANPDAGCAFAATMTSTDTWMKAAKASKADRAKSGGEYLGTWTANEDADAKIFADVYEPSKVPPLAHAVEVLESLQSVAVVDPPCPAAAEVKKAWEDAVLRTLQHDQSAEEALKQAQDEAQSAIDQAS